MISMMSAELKLTLCVSVASQSHVSCVPIVPINIESQLIRSSYLFGTAHVQLVATVANYVISPLLRMALDGHLRSSMLPSPLPMRFNLHPRTCLPPRILKVPQRRIEYESVLS